MLAGRDKGKHGEVVEMLPKENRALVRGVNVVRRHQKQTAAHEGGIISKEAPIHISNLALEDPEGRQADPRRLQDAGRRQEGSLRQALRRSHSREIRAMADNEKPAKGAGAPKAARRRRAPRRAKGEKKAGRSKGAGAPAAPRPKDYKPRMKSHYEKVVREAMPKKFGYKNTMQVPRIEKIVLNMGVGEAVNDRKKVDSAAEDLALIAGQTPGADHARARPSPPTSCAKACRSAPR